MDCLGKVIAVIVFCLLLFLQVPAVVGSFIVQTYKPDHDINMKTKIDDGWERMLSITADGNFILVEDNDSLYVLQSHKYGAIRAFHIGPFFDNVMGGKYKILSTLIRPKVAEVLEISIYGFDGTTIANSRTIERDSHFNGKIRRLIIYKDGHYQFFNYRWEPVDQSEMIDAEFNAFAKGFEDS